MRQPGLGKIEWIKEDGIKRKKESERIEKGETKNSGKKTKKDSGVPCNPSILRQFKRKPIKEHRARRGHGDLKKITAMTRSWVRKRSAARNNG
jgi:hypothetical protein